MKKTRTFKNTIVKGESFNLNLEISRSVTEFFWLIKDLDKKNL